MTIEWHDGVGAIGVVMIAASYLLLQLGKMSGTSVSYSLINAAGALAILISLLYEFNLSAFLIESFWLAASLFGIAYRTRNRHKAVQLPETESRPDG